MEMEEQGKLDKKSLMECLAEEFGAGPVMVFIVIAIIVIVYIIHFALELVCSAFG